MTLDQVDRSVSGFMARVSEPALRISLGVVFLWFGILKPFGVSAAAPLVEATVGWMPLLTPTQWVGVIGWWEVVIGVLFLAGRGLRLAILLLGLQMAGTVLPLFILPGTTFQDGRIPWGPTMEGQYIIKNLLIISAALAVGGTVRRQSAPSQGR